MWLSSKSDVGNALSSYLISSSLSNCPVPKTRNRWKSNQGSMLLTGTTLTADELLRVFALLIFLKENENTRYPSILCAMFLPTDSYSCTLTSSFATMPLMMFLREGSAEKGERDDIFVYIFEMFINVCINVWNVSFNYWDTGIFALFVCGVWAFIKVFMTILYSDIIEVNIAHNASSCFHELNRLLFQITSWVFA